MTKNKTEKVDKELVAGCAVLSADQRAVFASAVRGQSVVDLGCGNLGLVREAAQFATHVLGVDKTEPVYAELPRNAEFRQSYFDLYRDDPETLLLSWPVSWATPGLMRAAQSAQRIIYIGQNVGGSCCGTPDLFRELLTRELLAYVPGVHNALIVVGRQTLTSRSPTYEEACGLVNSTVVPGQTPPPWLAEPSWVCDAWNEPPVVAKKTAKSSKTKKAQEAAE